MLDIAEKRAGRPRKDALPRTPLDRMIDALTIWQVNLNQPQEVRDVLRVAGFTPIQIDGLCDIAVAAAKARHAGRRQ